MLHDFGAIIITDAADADHCYNATLGDQSYLGRLNTTSKGKQCQRWDVDTPHARDPSYVQDSLFVEGDLASVENYCRNPGGLWTTFWCYTTDPSVEYEDCNIWKCFEKNGINITKINT